MAGRRGYTGGIGDAIYGDTDQRNYSQQINRHGDQELIYNGPARMPMAGFGPSGGRSGYNGAPQGMGMSTAYGQAFNGYSPNAPASPRMSGGQSYSQSQPEPGMASVNMSGSTTPVQMPVEQMMRMQNMGTLARGPSPQSSAGMAQARQQAPQMQSPQMGMAPAIGNMNGYSQAPPTPGMAGAGPAPQSFMSSKDKADLKAYHSRLKGEYSRMDKEDKDGRAAKLGEIQSIEEKLYPRPASLGPGPGASMMGFLGPGTSPQMPYTNPQTGAPQMRAPITDANRINVDPKQREKALRTAYGTAARSLDENPHLGEKPVTSYRVPNPAADFAASGRNPNAPVSVLTPSQSRQAVEAGPEQTQRNIAATQRGHDANTARQIESNAGQYAQNKGATENIRARAAQFDEGNFDLSQSALSNFHINPQTGQRIGWDGKAWVKAQ